MWIDIWFATISITCVGRGLVQYEQVDAEWIPVLIFIPVVYDRCICFPVFIIAYACDAGIEFHTIYNNGVFWGYGFGIYRVPPSLDQLEKEVELVNWITSGLQQQVQEIKGIGIYNLFPWIDQEWLQLISYDDVKDIWTWKAADIPADTEAKNYFVFTTAFEYLVLAKLKTRNGILSHNSFYEDHSDGSFLTLYTWLRLKKGKDKDKAYELCKTLMKDHHFMVSLKSNTDKKIMILNVVDANLV